MNNQPLQILVVEDDALDRLTMKRALAGSGIRHQLHFSEDHESGLEATRDTEYDCIFLDYNLPDGSGLELLKAIRAVGNTSPIIIVTSQGDEKIAVEAMKNGANDYIPKSLLTNEGIAQSVRYMVKLKEKERVSLMLQQRLVETQKQLETVVANSPIILFALDHEARFTLCEGKGLETLGINRIEILRQPLSVMTNLPDSQEAFDKAMQGQSVVRVVEIKNRFFEVRYSPVYKDDGVEVNGVIGVASDITNHILAEQELKNAKQIAEETARMKEQFLANMSHEIRTPLNGIMGLTHILLDSPLNEEQNRYLESIRTCSDNLLVIINDILDLSKIEAGKMIFERVPFRLQDVVTHSIELFQSKADERSLRLQVQLDPALPAAIVGDPTRLSQILNNLVSNAIKFTSEGEVSVNVRLRSSRTENITVDFEVRDTGIGIPDQCLHSIFDSFTQASSDTTRKYGGTGLGLTIVKRLVEMQGGNIEVRSRVNKGTAFHFHLTFEITEESRIQSTHRRPGEEISISHLRVLAAEDNPINQMILRKLFSDWKTTLIIADNGKLALEALLQDDFDIILMDMQMPEMDGYTAGMKIRQEFGEPKCSLPIIAITAHATSSERTKCLGLGMNGYISKPFEPVALKKMIQELTNSGSASLNNSFGPSGTENGTQETSTVYASLPPASSTEAASGNIQPVLASVTEHSSGNMISDSSSENKIDLQYLKSIAEGNDAFMIEMIEMFLNKTPQALEKMNECFNQRNWEELRQIAHRIKPSYGYVGMKDLQQFLADIERLSEMQSDPDQVKQLLLRVGNGSALAFSQLQQELVSLR